MTSSIEDVYTALAGGWSPIELAVVNAKFIGLFPVSTYETDMRY
jgi:hypothetical protein